MLRNITESIYIAGGPFSFYSTQVFIQDNGQLKSCNAEATWMPTILSKETGSLMSGPEIMVCGGASECEGALRSCFTDSGQGKQCPDNVLQSPMNSNLGIPMLQDRFQAASIEMDDSLFITGGHSFNKLLVQNQSKIR